MPARKEVVEVSGREVIVSNPDKVFFPTTGHTKLDLERLDLAGRAVLRELDHLDPVGSGCWSPLLEEELAFRPVHVALEGHRPARDPAHMTHSLASTVVDDVLDIDDLADLFDAIHPAGGPSFANGETDRGWIVPEARRSRWRAWLVRLWSNWRRGPTVT